MPHLGYIDGDRNELSLILQYFFVVFLEIYETYQSSFLAVKKRISQYFISGRVPRVPETYSQDAFKPSYYLGPTYACWCLLVYLQECASQSQAYFLGRLADARLRF